VRRLTSSKQSSILCQDRFRSQAKENLDLIGRSNGGEGQGQAQAPPPPPPPQEEEDQNVVID
jgi:hypothetical protein